MFIYSILLNTVNNARDSYTLAIGVYPAVSLVDARKKRDEAKDQLSKDIDPAITKALNKHIVRTAAENTFKAVALEWHVKTSKTWAESTANNIKRYLEKDIFPWLGNRAIKDIGAPDLLAVMRKIESRGAHEKAQRCREYAGRVCFAMPWRPDARNAILAGI